MCLIILCLAFCLNEFTLTYFLPLSKTHFDVWMNYYITRDGVYDAMFSIFSFMCLWNLREPKIKTISLFIVIITTGSFIDKVIFGLNQYLKSDLFLFLGGGIYSIYKYKKWKIQKFG